MKFDFTDAEIQQIVNTLAQRPYGEVFELMNNIQRQAAQQKQPQLQAVQPEAQTG
jgi:hypothetical protein